MLPAERERLAEQVGMAVLRMRSDAQRFLGEAQSAGDAKMARKWTSELRKLDARIAKYGLSRYADRN